MDYLDPQMEAYTGRQDPQTIYRKVERIEELEPILQSKPLVFGDPLSIEYARLCRPLQLITSDEFIGYHDFLREKVEQALSAFSPNMNIADRLREDVLARLRDVCSQSAYEIIEAGVGVLMHDKAANPSEVSRRFEELQDELGYEEEEERIYSLEDLRKYHARVKELIKELQEGVDKEKLLEDLYVLLGEFRPPIRGLILSAVEEELDLVRWPVISLDAII